MKRIVLVFCLLFSFLAYFYAPIGFSEKYTSVLSLVFGVSSLIMLFNNCRFTIIKFEFFFVLAFFFTNVVYTLVYFQVNPYFGLFNLPFNEDYISKGFALSIIGICSFNIGVFDNNVHQFEKKKIFPEKYKSPKLVTIVLMLLFLPYMFTLVQRHEYTTEFESNLVNVILVYLVYFSLFYIFYYSKKGSSFSYFVRNNKSNALLYFIILYLIVFLLVGSRTIPLRIILLTLFLYSFYIMPIKSYKVAVLIAVGAIFMTFLGVIRSGGTFSFDSTSTVFDFGKELTINNRSLYVLMEYVDEKGITFGKSMLMGVLSIIPFGQRIYLMLTSDPLSSISSGVLVTDLYFDTSYDERIGLGTNIIGDIYLAFGIVGVLALMFFLGRFVTYVYKRASTGSNISILMYGVLFMDAIYYPRSTFLTSARAIVWVFLIYLLFLNKRKIETI